MNDAESEYANPGIAFLWSDERSRRCKLQEDVSFVSTFHISVERDGCRREVLDCSHVIIVFNCFVKPRSLETEML